MGVSVEQLEYTPDQLFEGFRPEDSRALREAVDHLDEQKAPLAITEDGTYHASIDQVFARFVQRLWGRVDLKVLQEVLVLLAIWRNSINNTYTQFEEGRYGCYSRDATCGSVLEIANDIVLRYFDEQESSFQAVLSGGKLFPPQKRPFHLTKFVYLFAKWLFAEKFTNSKLQLNTYEVEQEPS